MKLYVCWNTYDIPRGHPCARAHDALRAAGYDPDVKRVFGGLGMPDRLFPGRQEVKRITGGSATVPVLVLEDGTVIKESSEIAAWAEANPTRDRS